MFQKPNYAAHSIHSILQTEGVGNSKTLFGPPNNTQGSWTNSAVLRVNRRSLIERFAEFTKISYEIELWASRQETIVYEDLWIHILNHSYTVAFRNLAYFRFEGFWISQKGFHYTKRFFYNQGLLRLLISIDSNQLWTFFHFHPDQANSLRLPIATSDARVLFHNKERKPNRHRTTFHAHQTKWVYQTEIHAHTHICDVYLYVCSKLP